METTVLVKKSSKRWGTVPFEKSVAAHPLLSKEYSAENNQPASQVFAGTGKKLKWICSISSCGYKWRATGNNRLNGCGCPACAHKVATPTYNLAALYPQLATEYSSKNGLPANEVIPGTHKKLWWQCSKCGHEWEAIGKNRIKGHGCPACAGKVATARNNLLATHPHLARQYHSDRNELPPNQVIAGTHHKLWWRCPICWHEWRATGASRVRGSNCPACAKRVVTSTNCLAFVYPELATQFSRRNLPLTTREVVAGGNKKVWWLCPRCGHQWPASVYRRIIGSGCPERCLKRGKIKADKK